MAQHVGDEDDDKHLKGMKINLGHLLKYTEKSSLSVKS